VIGRNGEAADRLVNACICGGLATSDAVWLQGTGYGSAQYIVRIAIDRSTGHLGTRQDTVVTGPFTRFSITADGTAIVMDEGTSTFNVWAVEMADVLTGRYRDDQRIAHVSSAVSAAISPDGARILMHRSTPLAGGRREWRYTVRPFAGGQETSLGGVGLPVAAFWTDSVTVAVSIQRGSGLRLTQVDVRTGVQRNGLDLPDSLVVDFAALPDGWIWIPAARDRFVLRQAGRTRTIPKPASYAFVAAVAAESSGERVFFGGRKGDSLLMGVLAAREGVSRHWAANFGEGGSLTPLVDGSVFLRISETAESATFYRATGPGQVERIGTSPRRLVGVSVASDLKRATVVEREYRADAWMSEVVRRER
jgi:hypothetical protein